MTRNAPARFHGRDGHRPDARAGGGWLRAILAGA
jgi:hypothetical protein